MTKSDILSEKQRAEDVILGSLGFGEQASLIEIQRKECGYSGLASWPDGEQFEFSYDEELDELELWALDILEKNQLNRKKVSKVRSCG